MECIKARAEKLHKRGVRLSDHHLDEIRFRRSRVNYGNKAGPIGVTRTVRMAAHTAHRGYLTFREVQAEVQIKNGVCSIALRLSARAI